MALKSHRVGGEDMDKKSLRIALCMLTEGGQGSGIPRAFREEAAARCLESQRWRLERGIQGFGIGPRNRGESGAGDLALKVYVEKKRPRSRLGERAAPACLCFDCLGESVPTDVEEIGRIALHGQPPAWRRPAHPGSSVAHVAVQRGTIGCLVRKRGGGEDRYILSNAHVLADYARAEAGAKVLQPAPGDGGKAPRHVIAELSAYVPYRVNGEANRVDAAIARVQDPASVSAGPGGRGAAPPGPGVAAAGAQVVKYGSMTGETHGVVLDIDFVAAIDVWAPSRVGGKITVRFKDQILCDYECESGDSGSAVLHRKTGKVLGLHFAGSRLGGRYTGISNKIGHVLQALDIELETDGGGP